MKNEEENIAHERPSSRPHYAGASQSYHSPPAHGQSADRPMSPEAAAAMLERQDETGRKQMATMNESRLNARIGEDRGRESITRQIGEQTRAHIAQVLRSSMRLPRPGQGINWYNESEGYGY